MSDELIEDEDGTLLETYNYFNSMDDKELKEFLSLCEESQRYNILKIRTLSLESFIKYNKVLIDFDIAMESEYAITLH